MKCLVGLRRVAVNFIFRTVKIMITKKQLIKRLKNVPDNHLLVLTVEVDSDGIPVKVTVKTTQSEKSYIESRFKGKLIYTFKKLLKHD